MSDFRPAEAVGLVVAILLALVVVGLLGLRRLLRPLAGGVPIAETDQIT